MDRAYSLLTVKAVDEGARAIEGIATTPATDRVGDIVEPEGAEFDLPLPLLWQHSSWEPIGHVTHARVTSKGIEIRATITRVDEPGKLKDRLDEAWQSIRSGLVRGLSIGFKALESARIEGTYSYRYIKWAWLELSAVTIPANAEATITTIRSIDAQHRAASGRAVPVVRATSPGVSGQSNPMTREGVTIMAKSIAEQISAFEATRAAKAARMEDIMNDAAEKGETLDAAQTEEYDGLAAELKAIDAHLARLSDLEKAAVKTAKPLADVRTADDAAAARGGGVSSGVVVKNPPKPAPGIRFARLSKVRAVSKLDNEPMLKVAERMYGADSEVYAVIKTGEVAAGSNISANWATALTGEEGSGFADFAAYLRPATILGKFGMNGVPDLRRVPFREPLLMQTGGGAAYWVGEGKPKGATAFNFTRTTIEPLKIANIAVLTEENVRSSNPNSEMLVRDALRDAIVAGIDTAFIDPTNNGSANVKPAAINYQAAAIVSTGTDADAIRLDLRALFEKFDAADNPPDTGVLVMSMKNARALAIMVNPLGQPEFPQMTMVGGSLLGVPVVASRYAGTNVSLINAADVYEADDGAVSVDMSREASIEMKDGDNLDQDATSSTGASLVSLWQSNLVGLRAERTINWMRRRTQSVAYLTTVNWGGAVPAS